MRRKTEQQIVARAPEFRLPLNIEHPNAPNFLPTQEAFIHDFKHHFQAYGGGLGNGKTSAGIAKAFQLSTLFPGNMGYMCRYDGKELKATTLAEFRRMVPASFFERSNDQIGYMKFKPEYGGSEIYYGDMKAEILNNLNLGWFWVDQAEEIDETRWNALVSRLRRQTPLYDKTGLPLAFPHGAPVLAPTYGFATFNPEGTASYLYRFFHPNSEERVCTCKKRSICLQHDYQLYEATTYDGRAAGFVNQDYVDSMLAVFPPEARRRYLEGAWDVFSGRIYPQFEMAVHVLDAIPIQPHWKLYESIDHGIINPTAVGWWAIDEQGNRFLVDEHYEGGGQPVKYHATVMKSKREQFKHPITMTYLDSACWARNQSRGDSIYAIADEYNEQGIFAIPGQKDWQTGYNRICQGLAIDPLHRHPKTGELGAPHIYVAAHCTNFIKEILGYRWKKNRITAQKNVPDQPMDYNDHHMDAWSYFEASRPIGAVLPEVKSTDVLERLHAMMVKRDPFRTDTSGQKSWMTT